MKNLNSLFSKLIFLFLITSNIYVLYKLPLIYSGGCNYEEYEAIQFLKNESLSEDFNINSTILSDLRIGSLIKTETNFNVFDAPGSQTSNSSELFFSYSIFYSKNVTQSYIEITKYLEKINIKSQNF